MKEYFKPFFNPWHYRLKDYSNLWAWKYTLKNCFYDNPRHLFRWTKWFFQRGSRGWADCDWWGMNCYLCEVVLPMLKKMKDEKHGVPCSYGEDFSEAEKRWDTCINDMIEAFEAAKRVLDDEYYEQVSGDRFDKVNELDSTESIDSFLGSIPRKEVKKWAAMSKADQKIFEKKAKVFIKHFFSLWD